jgi:hypothetical protein
VTQTVYYLPGHGGLISTGLGAAIADRGFAVTGRETVGEFYQLPFQEQVRLVADDLERDFWSSDARVVANSFGGYLFLHAQALLDGVYSGRVLILSPIVGGFTNEQTMRRYYPPSSERLMELANLGVFNTPAHAEIHVGAEDWQSHPDKVTEFGQLAGIPVTVIPGMGHMLNRVYVGSLLDQLFA